VFYDLASTSLTSTSKEMSMKSLYAGVLTIALGLAAGTAFAVPSLETRGPMSFKPATLPIACTSKSGNKFADPAACKVGCRANASPTYMPNCLKWCDANC
jgi:hypothetical protein